MTVFVKKYNYKTLWDFVAEIKMKLSFSLKQLMSPTAPLHNSIAKIL